MEDGWTAPLFRAWAEESGGELLYSGQADQISFVGEKVPLSATPDGLAVKIDRDALKSWGVPDIGKSKQLVIELKSIDPRYAAHKLPKSPHVPQTLTQIGMIRHATKYRPEWGVVAYCDASNYFDLKLFPVKWDEKAFKGLVNRASKILAANDPNEMAPEGKINGGAECTECKHAKKCLGFLPWVAGDDPRALKKDKVAKVEAVARVVHLAEIDAEKAQQKVRDAQARLVETLNQVGRRFVMGTKFVASAKPTSVQMRDDVQAMKAAMRKRGMDPEAFKKPTKPGVSISVEMR